MKVLITLDHEIFFGNDPGDPFHCMVKPLDALLKVTEPHSIPLCIFVDCGYLLKLRENMGRYPNLEKGYQAITKQLKELAKKGHDIQLHIHPHWEDTHYDGKKWQMDLTRYRLQDFSQEKIQDIVERYCSMLEDIGGKPPFAFRAGGWCLQPFDKLRKPFFDNDIRIDSTVFPGGFREGVQRYDFRATPDKPFWRFSQDPCEEEAEGDLLEVPISSYSLSPAFFWKFAATKKLGGNNHEPFGNGSPVANASMDLFRLLTKRSLSVVSIDGFKASFLQKAFHTYKERWGEKGYFVVLGHPKALTPYSLGKLNKFLYKNKKDIEGCTFKEALREITPLNQ